MQDKPKRKSKGIGDVIETITEAVGIKKCNGCENRKQWLNLHFPFYTPKILTDEQKEQIEKEPLEVYNEAFNANLLKEHFTGAVKDKVIKKLKKLSEYEN